MVLFRARTGVCASLAGYLILTVLVRPAQLADLDGLVRLEEASFETDKLSRRSFRHWITTDHRALLVAQTQAEQRIVGYILIIYHPAPVWREFIRWRFRRNNEAPVSANY